MGSYGSGHYTAFCQNEETRKWLLYNDDDVMEVQDDEVDGDVVCNRDDDCDNFYDDDYHGHGPGDDDEVDVDDDGVDEVDG